MDMPKKLKPGPRPMAAKDKRTLRVQVPVNVAEHAAVRRAAGKASIGSWARAVLMTATEDPSTFRVPTTAKPGGRKMSGTR